MTNSTAPEPWQVRRDAAIARGLERLKAQAAQMRSEPSASFPWGCFVPGRYKEAASWRCNGFFPTKQSAEYHARHVAGFPQFIVGKLA